MLNENEVAPFLQELKQKHPQVEMSLSPEAGTTQIMLQSETKLDLLVEEIKKNFSTFYYGEDLLERAIQKSFIESNNTLALAESCTGGQMAAKLTMIPDASKYFLGSIVAYSNEWKERFLHVSRTTLKEKGAVSREVVTEMVQGLFNETNADFGVAISGVAGPGGGTEKTPVGTVYIAIGKRGQKIDAGLVQAPQERSSATDLAVHLALGALWRRLVHNTASFS